jgi:hypothetical protein
VSEPEAAVVFLSWLRRGLSTEITRVDKAGPPGARAELSVTLAFNDASLTPGVSVELLGPGEVTGLDRRAVIRTWPAAGVSDAEPNLFPIVEFDQADLPWRYTPARADAKDRLRPWLCLVVLADDEIVAEEAAGRVLPLPAVTAAEAALLPDLSQAWAWAHVQIGGVASDADSAGVPEIVSTAAHRMTARLVAPRRLDAGTAYTALVVPTFERGRLAGLGETVPDDLDALAPAWSLDAAPVRLPVFYRWRFQTGPHGDFEFLVRLLRPRPLPTEVGIRPMDVRHPGAGLPAAADVPLGLEGALRTPDTESTEWPEPDRLAFVGELAILLNRPADLLADDTSARVVAPPLYGRWHAAEQRLEPGGRPVWFQELNADPRLRVAAGLGTQVVQAQQQQLMAAAWLQVDGIRRANEDLRLAQVARELATRLYERRFRPAEAEQLLELTAPLHSRIAEEGATVSARFARSPIADGVLEAPWRRVVRPLGPVRRRQPPPEAPRPPVLRRLNVGELSPAPPPATPRRLATAARTGKALVDAQGGGSRALKIALRNGALKPAQINTVRPRPDFEPAGLLGMRAREIGPGRPSSRPGPELPGRDNQSALAFRRAAAALFGSYGTAPEVPEPLVVARLPRVRNRVVEAIDPRARIAAAMSARLRFGPDVIRRPRDPLDQVMAAPDFPQPMYEPLAELSQDLLLPGLELIPANTVALLETNQRFVEAYMVGLSHEMARELLWNEFPNDQRGTYFRQFWDVRGYVAPAGADVDPETLRDIKLIHTWPRLSPLGANTARRPPPGGSHLVLLVRGELLRRYPNTVVYAANAVLAAPGERKLGTEEAHPVFSGRLLPDITFFGFELTVEQVRGSEDPSEDQGWFFVLQEAPGEIRFGLDVPSGPLPLTDPGSWNELSWGHLAASDAALAEIAYVDLDAELPMTVADPTAPGVAWHADAGSGPKGSKAAHLARITIQRPVRVAVHGSDMLPATIGEG